MLASGGPPSSPSSTAHSISRPVMAASTRTLRSYRRAVSIAASSPARSSARDVPMLEPPRAGLTNTGQPSSPIASSTRLRSASAAAGPQSRSRTTTNGPTGSPLAAKISFMYSLSMPTALASTPGADVADARHLQQALDGAVLAEGAVQQGQDHVHLAQLGRDGGAGR